MECCLKRGEFDEECVLVSVLLGSCRISLSMKVSIGEEQRVSQIVHVVRLCFHGYRYERPLVFTYVFDAYSMQTVISVNRMEEFLPSLIASAHQAGAVLASRLIRRVFLS